MNRKFSASRNLNNKAKPDCFLRDLRVFVATFCILRVLGVYAHCVSALTVYDFYFSFDCGISGVSFCDVAVVSVECYRRCVFLCDQMLSDLEILKQNINLLC